MLGNVAEWDWVLLQSSLRLGDGPAGSRRSAGSPRVLRGGSWADGPGMCRVSFCLVARLPYYPLPSGIAATGEP